MITHEQMRERLIKQKIVSFIFSKFPFYILAKLAQANLIIAYYHMVSDEEVLHIKHLYDHKNVRQFKDDLDFLLKRYTPISLFDIMDFVKNGCPLSEKALLLTFDDGFREMHDVVAPILLEKGIPATFFLNSDFIDNKRLCYLHKASILAEHVQKMGSFNLREKLKVVLSQNEVECNDIKTGLLSLNYNQKDLLNEIALLININFDDYLLENKPYLASDQIKRLVKDGFTIGAHSIDHPLYALLTLKDQLYQTIESVKQIRDKFSLDYGVFAFPHSDKNVSRKFFIELYKDRLVDISFGTSGLLKDSHPYNLQRISMENPFMSAEKIIALQYAKKVTKLITGKDEIIRN